MNTYKRVGNKVVLCAEVVPDIVLSHQEYDAAMTLLKIRHPNYNDLDDRALWLTFLRIALESLR